MHERRWVAPGQGGSGPLAIDGSGAFMQPDDACETDPMPWTLHRFHNPHRPSDIVQLERDKAHETMG